MEKEQDGFIEIDEEIINFKNEPESYTFLNKKAISQTYPEGVTFGVQSLKKKLNKSKKGKDYVTYTMTVTDGYSVYTVDNIFRHELKWGRIQVPKYVIIKSIPDGEFFKWDISSSVEK